MRPLYIIIKHIIIIRYYYIILIPKVLKYNIVYSPVSYRIL